ncbi:prenyltransferase/squalene oxidase repeat-containing protein [Schlesneria sp. T3-172]|uniref:prenyltransferase/squalene oxidase repeat-containing protein n=1 Tax=Schlesneria TaxID=656899 RepID=UPI002F1C898E
MIQPNRPCLVALIMTIVAGLSATPAQAQAPSIRIGEVVPRDVREIYEKGLQYLVANQTEAGDWKGGGEQGPGVTGLCLMVLLASGEDPNFGLYSNNVRRALRSIISGQDGSTGFYGGQGHSSMYNHGFAMLALAEAYGAVDDRNLWTGNEANRRTIGQSLELAVRAAVTSQKKNSFGGWRYSPDATDADTSVSGAVLVGLLAARNAGIEVPDEVIDKSLNYFTKMTSPSGQVGYSGGFGGFDESFARISIATLVYSVGRRKDLSQFKATLNYLVQRLDNVTQQNWPEYTRYYQAQALFQGDVEAWEKWNKLLVRHLKQIQAVDGSIQGQMGTTLGTSMSCLALALNYRFLPIYER